MNKLHVKKGDEVVVINGKDRGSRGKVMEVSPSEGNSMDCSPPGSSVHGIF